MPGSGDVQIYWLIICALVALAGLLRIVHGIRGRRVGDHPYCAKCGFDLFGKPPESTRCAECGADLDALKSLVIGQRQRDARQVSIGLAMLLIGGVLLGAGTMFELKIGTMSPPARIPGLVYIRVGGRELKLGQRHGHEWSSTGAAADLHTLELPADTKTIDVILRPDPDWERNTTELIPPWGHEMIFRDVKVLDHEPHFTWRAPPPTTSPAQ